MVQVFMMFISLAFAKNYNTPKYIKITDNTPKLNLTAPAHAKNSALAVDQSFESLSGCKKFAKKIKGSNSCWSPLKSIGFHCSRSRYAIGQSLRRLKTIMDKDPNTTTSSETKENLKQFSRNEWLDIYRYKDAISPWKQKIIDCTKGKTEKIKVAVQISYLLNAYDKLIESIKSLVSELTPKNQSPVPLETSEVDSSS